MDYYVDVKVLRNPEFLETLLMNKLFSHLHTLLARFGNGKIGISFPEVKVTLGAVVRLHGHQGALQEMMQRLSIAGFQDYVSVSEVAPIPKEVAYRVVKRVQAKSSPERLFRRSVRSGRLTAEEALLKMSQEKAEKLSLPYVRLKSQTTGQFFLLFVEHGPILSDPITGDFSAYGLSSKATIPWF